VYGTPRLDKIDLKEWSMSDTFDPYYKWFDIPPDEQSAE